MNLGTRRAALRAAAKVALAVSAFGCGGTIDGTTAGPGDAAVDQRVTRFEAGTSAETSLAEASLDTSVLDAVAFDGPLACNLPSAITATTPIDQSMFDCCAALATADAGFDLDAGDPEAAQCCKAMIQHIDQEYLDAGMQASADMSKIGPELRTCCSSEGWPGGPACLAWGPPTPPSMQEVA